MTNGVTSKRGAAATLRGMGGWQLLVVVGLVSEGGSGTLAEGFSNFRAYLKHHGEQP